MDPAVLVGIPVTLGTVISGFTYVVRKVIETDKRIGEHMTSDEVKFEAFSAMLKDLKDGQGTQSAKLDRLIEHMLPKPVESAPKSRRRPRA